MLRELAHGRATTIVQFHSKTWRLQVVRCRINPQDDIADSALN
jgi:hypothetical protein